MPRHPSEGTAVVEKYLFEIAPKSGAHDTTAALRLVADRLNVTITTLHRWRARGYISGAQHVVIVLRAVEAARKERGNTTPCTLDDVQALAGDGDLL